MAQVINETSLYIKWFHSPKRLTAIQRLVVLAPVKTQMATCIVYYNDLELISLWFVINLYLIIKKSIVIFVKVSAL